ncbi:HPr kinase/phosphorylase [Rhizobium sp. RAF56]|jgi:serine kinase of HPr protein (carbohydrate metabolism regulator)|uniref:HPr kinase/phosphorylase n=1 Tax=Rhizobium sp. RAF56 TaxID=3233062 RepID=UPI003F9858FA
MIGKAANVHATAIVVETTGLIFVGPSGSGKSSLAFSCLAEARALGLSAVLVADDQVFLSLDGADVVARCPPTIAGLMEVRGTGIISLPYQSQAVLHYAVMPIDLAVADRLPPEDERLDLAADISLPLIRISSTARNPLAIIMAKIPVSGR